MSKHGSSSEALAPAGILSCRIWCLGYVQLAVCGFQNEENMQSSHQDGYVRDDKQPYEKKAAKLKEKYEKDIATYRAKGKPDAAKKGVVKAEKSKKKKEEEEDKEGEEDKEEEEDEEDEDEEDDDD
ncbi:High mobility group protein B2 [Tupaia chinensis]|uniref:High mobility group protein B2 n=1 Tax=Tupaia chinensis TaxID=246437 RepID=L9L003_TUPCH|nr:High mobility group protein B2 [Tupaia chinensis]